MSSGFWTVFAPIIAAAVLSGALSGGLGCFVVAMRLPFLALFTAHAALAGAIFGQLLGISVFPAGALGALAGSLLLGLFLRRHTLDPGAALGTLFSLMLGLAFLGIGLMHGPKSEALGFMWGSLLFVRFSQLISMAVVALVFTVVALLFENELKLLLFSRELAALHLNEGVLFTAFLVLSAAVIAVCLEAVGGILLYSLVCNPAVAALRVARSWRGALLLSVALGIISAVTGFWAAYHFDLPVGACIVITSSGVVGFSLLWKDGSR